jgi:hypothetical protein
MNVIDMTVQVFLVPYNMIPEAVMPYSTRPVDASVAPPEGHLESMHNLRDRPLTDSNKSVEVIGKYDPCIELDARPGRVEELRAIQQNRSSSVTNDRDKEGGVTRYVSS